MQTYLDCYPCVLRQALEAARMAKATAVQEWEIVQQTLGLLQATPPGSTPPEIGDGVHRIVRKVTGNQDPYRKVKQESTQKALALLPRLREILAEAEDPLETAIRLSIAGNIIDFGPNPVYDLWEVVNRVLHQPFSINDLPVLRQRLGEVRSVLFLADNAGETVFDRLLVEILAPAVTYVVRGGPALNDATREDALAAGLGQVAEVIDNGLQTTGTVLESCDPGFRKRFNEAELIFSKGMGNYETLSDVPAPIFFLLQVKCPIIGRDIDASQGSIVIKQGNGRAPL